MGALFLRIPIYVEHIAEYASYRIALDDVSRYRPCCIPPDGSIYSSIAPKGAETVIFFRSGGSAFTTLTVDDLDKLILEA